MDEPEALDVCTRNLPFFSQGPEGLLPMELVEEVTGSIFLPLRYRSADVKFLPGWRICDVDSTLDSVNTCVTPFSGFSTVSGWVGAAEPSPPPRGVGEFCPAEALPVGIFFPRGFGCLWWVLGG